MRLASLSTLALSVPITPPSGGRGHPLAAPFVTYCLVRAETDDGLVGWGEISDGWGCEYAQVADALVREALSRFLIGEDPLEVATLMTRMWTWLRRRQGTQWLVAQAVSGVEIALWDLAARAAGQSVSELLGPRLRETVPVYATGLALSQGDASVHHAFFAPLLARGLRAVKMRLGPSWRAELQTLREVRGLLGQDVTIGIDGNETFSAKTAARIAETLDELGIAFFEEPIPRTDPAALAWLVRVSRVPIAYGEHVHTVEGFRELSDRRLADIWQPDVTACGGFLEAKRIAALAAARATRISPHSATTPLGIAANLHAASVAPTLWRMECSATAIDELADCFEGSGGFTGAIAEGTLTVPRGPGLGIAPKEEELRARSPYRPPWPVRTLPTLYRGVI
jgi:L-alanine-DL-glutamate epimerase-like enolase superfamily enzyme